MPARLLKPINTKKMNIHIKINTRGFYEQEKAYLFSGLYQNSHVLNKNTVQKFENFHKKYLKLKK
jgi:hypothetical protein